jgi:hypothetical protein
MMMSPRIRTAARRSQTNDPDEVEHGEGGVFQRGALRQRPFDTTATGGAGPTDPPALDAQVFV